MTRKRELEKEKVSLAREAVRACAICDSTGFHYFTNAQYPNGAMRQCTHDPAIEGRISPDAQNGPLLDATARQEKGPQKILRALSVSNFASGGEWPGLEQWWRRLRASAAFLDKGIKALEPTKVRVAFVTHLHSDHTVGYPDLIFTPWTVGRRVPLEVYGPKCLKAMTEHLLEAYRVGIETRTNPDGNQRGFPEGHRVNAHEISPGVVYKDANVTVTAFATKVVLRKCE